MSETGGLSREEADALVLKYHGWAESIAKNVARSWNLDWEMDGLDGAAMEALVFCSRRYNPEMGVPFKGYARRRIHEASTEAARKSKGWVKKSKSDARTERLAREVSVELLNVFPELRSGRLPTAGESGVGDGAEARVAIQQLLVGASVIATKQGLEAATPDEAMDFKRMLERVGALERLHQLMIWKVYWEGMSLRGVAGEWDTDELNIIREHKVLLDFLQKAISMGRTTKPPRLRPALKKIADRVLSKVNFRSFRSLIHMEDEHE